jgi:hypothetical protein
MNAFAHPSTLTDNEVSPSRVTSPFDGRTAGLAPCEGRGPAIRKAREAGLEQARLRRLDYHRHHRQQQPSEEPGDVG